MASIGTGQVQPRSDVLQSIAAASRQSGVSFDYLLNQAKMESGFNPAAKAPTSSASGLYQFTRQTWLSTIRAHGADHGLGWAADAITRGPGGKLSVRDPALRDSILALRNDPQTASSMAAEFASDNRDYLVQQLGRDPTAGDLALAHFLGAEGASRFLSAAAADPDASAAPLFPEAAAANRSIFYDSAGAPRSLAVIQARFEAKAGGDNVPAPSQATWTTHQQFSTSSRSAPQAQLRDFVPMPSRLSLEFAQAAYRRLASMGESA